MIGYSLTEAVAFLADIGPHVDKGLSGIRVFCVLLVGAMVVAVGAIAGAKARAGSDFAVAAVLGALGLGLFWAHRRVGFPRRGTALRGACWHEGSADPAGGRILCGGSASNKHAAKLLGIAVSLWALSLVALTVS